MKRECELLCLQYHPHKNWEQREHIFETYCTGFHMIIRLTTSINTSGLPFFKHNNKINTGIFL